MKLEDWFKEFRVSIALRNAERQLIKVTKRVPPAGSQKCEKRPSQNVFSLAPRICGNRRARKTPALQPAMTDLVGFQTFRTPGSSFRSSPSEPGHSLFQKRLHQIPTCSGWLRK